MYDNSVIEEYWYVYVMLHPSRNLKVEISRENRKSNLLLNYKVILIKKYKYLNKEKAFQKKNYIENLSWEERENLIMDALIKKTKPLIVEKISNNSFVIICPECKYRNQLNCQDNELANKTYGFKCMHEILKEKIDTLFEQAILGAMCFHNGKYMFKGKDADMAGDYLLGFSGRQHKKRTMKVYEFLDEISFKNSYLLLSAILEEAYYLIQNNAKKYTSYNLPEDYRKFSFDELNKYSIMGQIKFYRTMDFVCLAANVLKHTGGIVLNEGYSGKKLISNFKIKEGIDLVTHRNILKIEKTFIGFIPYIISQVYIGIMDLTAEIFGFEKFRIKNRNKVINNLLNYEVRKEFEDFCRSINDGSVIFFED